MHYFHFIALPKYGFHFFQLSGRGYRFVFFWVKVFRHFAFQRLVIQLDLFLFGQLRQRFGESMLHRLLDKGFCFFRFAFVDFDQCRTAVGFGVGGRGLEATHEIAQGGLRISQKR